MASIEYEPGPISAKASALSAQTRKGMSFVLSNGQTVTAIVTAQSVAVIRTANPILSVALSSNVDTASQDAGIGITFTVMTRMTSEARINRSAKPTRPPGYEKRTCVISDTIPHPTRPAYVQLGYQ